MAVAVERLGPAAVAGSWTVQPLILVAAAVALIWYLRAAGRRDRWPAARTATFVGGLIVLLAVSCGPPAVFARSVYWVWVSQALTLLLVVPVPLMSGQPMELAGPGRPVALSRAMGSRFGRAFRSPLVGPALVPLVCVAAFFGPVPGWVAQYPAAQWLVQLLLVGIGCLIVLPLVATGDTASSVAVGAAVAVGFVELLVDAVPGIVLRLSTHPVSSFFDHRVALAHAPNWLHDQQIGGGVLWCVAELLDLPFLILIFRRWVRADAREAAVVDAELDAHEAAGEGEQPWFLSDPRLRDRLR